MRKNLNKKAITKARETKQQAVTAELSEISQKREQELAEMDRIAKLLVRRDLELSEAVAKLEKQRNELDRIAKLLVRRDFELTETRETRETELKELEKKTKELEESRTALMNMLEDVEESRKALTNVLEDVDEARKKAEEERDKTAAIIVNFADGLLVFDKEGRLSSANLQAEEFFGIKAKNMTRKTVLELAEIPNLHPLISILGAEIKGVYRKELPVKDNLTLEVSTVPMMSGQEVLGTFVVLHDITREKMVERIKTEFVSLAAHQLRTPLAAIKWTLRMLLDGDLGEITAEQREFIEKTYQSNERMIALINDLLDVTRIEEGRYLYKPSFAQFESIVQFVINSLKEEVQKKGIKFEFKKPIKKLPKVKIDVEKIRLTINNLLDNAIRYTPLGGGITVSLSRLKHEIEFSIKDTGVGIPKDQQARVFTKFFRGANVMRLATEGTGLGLFITKNIIEAHGGKIWFESEENKGTTFYFTLPLKEEFTEFLKEF